MKNKEINQTYKGISNLWELANQRQKEAIVIIKELLNELSNENRQEKK
jgi:hypothetical protein